MFAGRANFLLRLQQVERSNQCGSGFAWPDYRFNVAATGRLKRIGKLLAVFIGEFDFTCCGIVRASDLATMD